MRFPVSFLFVILLAPIPGRCQPTNVHLRSDHFDASAAQGSAAARELQTIVNGREKAFAEIADLFDVHPDIEITLLFFPDQESKKRATGHSGLGWAEGTSIVEVYNDTIKLDPYHELVHIIGGVIGRPPAFLDEGAAVYFSERLGADALKLLGRPGTSIDEAACRIISSGTAVPLDSLFDFTELGSAKSRGPVSYPQSASIVKFLVERYGMKRFRRAYRELHNPIESSLRMDNRSVFKSIYGKTAGEIESEWRLQLCK